MGLPIPDATSTYKDIGLYCVWLADSLPTPSAERKTAGCSSVWLGRSDIYKFPPFLCCIVRVCVLTNVICPSICQLSCSSDAGFVGGSDNGIAYGMPAGQAQQMQMQYMRDQLRQELQQRSFLSHAQVGSQNTTTIYRSW